MIRKFIKDFLNLLLASDYPYEKDEEFTDMEILIVFLFFLFLLFVLFLLNK